MADFERAHFVPEFILENFAASDNRLRACYKTLDGEIKKRFKAGAKDLCVRDNFYDQYGSRKDTEHKLGKLERDVGAYIDKISKFEKLNEITFSIEEKVKLAFFTFIAQIRSADLRTTVPSLKDFEQDALADSDKEKLYNMERARRIEIFLDNLEKECAAGFRNNPGFGISIGTTDGREFIIGGMPVVNTKTIKGIWHPITPRLAIAANNYDKVDIGTFKQPHVDEINTQIYKLSTLAAASSEELLDEVIMLSKQR